MAHPPCCPKAELLYTANSPPARDMRPLILSSQVQARRVQVTRQVQRHHRQNPDMKMSVAEMTLHSCLC